MKKWKSLLSLLLVLLLLVGCSQTPGDATTEPVAAAPQTEPTGPKPQRPDDPGVVPPLGGNEDVVPENGIVWDMEALPDVLSGSPWATHYWASHADYVENRVQILTTDGKGYQGSRALTIRQNQNYNWCDVFTVGFKKDETAATRWTFGDILWIWYDATEMSGNIMLELKLNGVNMSMGLPYYSMEDGADTATVAGQIPEGWTGAGYGRIPIITGGKYWVGVPLEAYGDERVINFMEVHIAGGSLGSVATPQNLYLDQFCITAAGEGPYGATISTDNGKQATSDAPAWTMDDAPADLLANYWASHDGIGWSTYEEGNIQILSAAGKGVGGSTAVQIQQVGPYNGADVFSLCISADPSAKTDWSDQTMLWLWVDTTELATPLALDVNIDGHKLAIGSPYYGINAQGETEKVGDLPIAWNGADYGRVPIGQGFAGWVGLPFSNFGYTPGEVRNIGFHVAYNDDVESNIGRCIYLDEVWVTLENEQPKDAVGGDINILAGKG